MHVFYCTVAAYIYYCTVRYSHGINNPSSMVIVLWRELNCVKIPQGEAN